MRFPTAGQGYAGSGDEIGFWNVRTMYEQGRMAQVIAENEARKNNIPKKKECTDISFSPLKQAFPLNFIEPVYNFVLSLLESKEVNREVILRIPRYNEYGYNEFPELVERDISREIR